MSKQSVDISEYLNTPALEAYRVLNANLSSNKKAKVILVISFYPGEGKTSVAINLAIAGAKSGTRVLYVDADLRKPRQLKRHGAAVGLMNFSNETGLEDVICRTNVENLEYVSAGNALTDPVEFLSSLSFKGFVEAVSQQYDLVVIDSSSLGKCVDGAIIAAKVSGVLVVTTSQKTSYKNIEQIKWQMRNVGATIIGIVINRIEKRDFKSYFVFSKKDQARYRKPKEVKLNT